jgi:hypothetical protein
VLILSFRTSSGRTIGREVTAAPVGIHTQLVDHRETPTGALMITPLGEPMFHQLNFEHSVCCPSCGWAGADQHPDDVEVLSCINPHCGHRFSRHGWSETHRAWVSVSA